MGARFSPEAELVAWRKVCALVSGAALSPTVDVLHRTGALGHLLQATEPEAISALAEAAGLHEGYAHVALGLLATQGLVDRFIDDGDTRRARVRFTQGGRRWAVRAGAYDGACARMAEARAVRAALQGGVHDGGGAASSFEVPHLPRAADELGERLELHRHGAVVAAVVGALGRLGALRRLYHAPLGWLAPRDLGITCEAAERVLPLLSDLGWIARDDDLIALTPEGRGAARWAPLFNYVYGYLGVYERATSLLVGASRPEIADEGRDASDRDLLLLGKAYVFRTGLSGPLEECLRALLGSGASSPRLVVDMNAGDGTVLAAYAEMARSGAMGRPPTLVALVRNPLAEERCRRMLSGREPPSLVLRVDFSDPADVATALAAHGLALRDALVLSKTTIHDRGFRGSAGVDLPPARGKPSEAVFVSPDGDWIEPRAMEDDLAAFFRRWRDHLGPLGLIAMDTHAVAPEVAARTWRENAVTHVAASHGYSSQYLIECERFREAARRAGLSSRFRRDLGSERVEAVTMSLDHFVP